MQTLGSDYGDTSNRYNNIKIIYTLDYRVRARKREEYVQGEDERKEKNSFQSFLNSRSAGLSPCFAAIDSAGANSGIRMQS